MPIAAVTAAMFALQGAGVLVLMWAGSSTAGAAGFVALFGLGFGVGTIARPALLADTFGVVHYATVAGVMAVSACATLVERASTSA